MRLQEARTQKLSLCGIAVLAQCRDSDGFGFFAERASWKFRFVVDRQILGALVVSGSQRAARRIDERDFTRKSIARVHRFCRFCDPPGAGCRSCRRRVGALEGHRRRGSRRNTRNWIFRGRLLHADRNWNLNVGRQMSKVKRSADRDHADERSKTNPFEQ